MWRLKRWKIAWLLAIVIIIGLLVTFRFTGTMQGSVEISETITEDTSFWNMNRQSDYFEIKNNITDIYANSTFSSNLTIYSLTYVENDGMLDFNDGLWISLAASSKAVDGFIYSMDIRFSKTDENATLDIIDDPDWMHLRGLAKENIVDGSQYREAFFETKSDGKPKECMLKFCPVWVFFDFNALDHWLSITLETVYFDGASYRQVNVPIQIGVLV
jgi:hypothetical protein